MDWTYKGKVIKKLEDFPKGSFGFVYSLTHKPTGRKYIGRKNLISVRNVKLGKKELELIREERRKKGIRGRYPTRKRVERESDWKTYYSSNKTIKKLVKEGNKKDFKREILYIAPNRKMLTYFETKYLFVKEVLENSDLYFNDNIAGTHYSKDFVDVD